MGSSRVGIRAFVDVPDAAEATLMLFEKAEAEGRYLCSSREIKTKALVEKLKSKYHVYNYPKSKNSCMQISRSSSSFFKKKKKKSRSIF